jgi:pantoate--beta-alanine ligase
MSDLVVVRTVSELRAHVAAWRRDGLSVGLVPTMGALHDGHLTLVRRALQLADRVVATIFVNPTQFGPNEDFTRYPRDEAADMAKLAGAGCTLLFAPAVPVMYPEGFSTTIDPGEVAEPLEGRFRPGHFQGVATVVTKLLLQCLPDVACFGEKDYQQLQVIKRVVTDLDLPVRIVGVETVREGDGMALSSRNRYLNPQERERAAALHRVLRTIADRLAGGTKPAAPAVAWATAELMAAGFSKVDYVAVVDAATLKPLKKVDRPGRILAAVHMHGTRLIDNLAVGPVPANSDVSGA